MQATGQQVKEAMEAEGINQVDHHACGICGVMVRYIRQDGLLYFDSSCDCNSLDGWRPATYEEAAEWINLQSKPETKAHVAARFGIKL